MIPKGIWNIVCVCIIACMLVMLVVLVPNLYNFQASTERAVYLRSAIFCCLVICLILFASTFADQRISMPTFYFMCLISVEFLSLYVEYQFWHFKAVSVSDYWLSFVYYLEDFVYPWIIWLFGRYQASILEINGRWCQVRKILDIIILVNCICLVLNIFTGCIFTVENGEFCSGPFVYMVFILPVMMAILTMLEALFCGNGPKQKIVFVGYVAIPILVIIYNLPHYSASMTYIAAMLSFIFMYGQIYLDRGLTLVRNEAAMTDKKVAMMLSRIEPGFLEEALDSIAALDGTPEETKNALVMYRNYLRTNVDSISKKEAIPFENELGHVKTYTSLEKMRFKDKLRVEFDIQDTGFKVPAMSVQMAVENAIKHGIMKKGNGGTVKISSYAVGEDHFVTVTDDGVGFDVSAPRDQSRSHVGMDNLSARVKDLCGGTVEIRSVIGKGTVVKITIPGSD